MFEKRGKAADDPPAIEILRHFAECRQRHAGLFRPRFPQVRRNLIRFELALQRHENAPFQIVQGGHRHFGHIRRRIGFAARFHAATTHVAHPERKQPSGRQQNEFLRAGLLREELAMFSHRIPLRHLERGPKFVL